jgi:hypothetical protein
MLFYVGSDGSVMSVGATPRRRARDQRARPRCPTRIELTPHLPEVVASDRACGLWQGGFATVRCRRCPEEFLGAFSSSRYAHNPSMSLQGLPTSPQERE